MKSPFEAFPIPTEMRSMAEQSMQQARQAFDSFVNAANEAASRFEDQRATAQAGAKDMSQRIMSFAEENVVNSFDYAQHLLRATDVAEMMKVHADYVQRQIKLLGEQAKELGESAMKAGGTKSGL